MFNEAPNPDSVGNICLLMSICKVRSSGLLHIPGLLTVLAHWPLPGSNHAVLVRHPGRRVLNDFKGPGSRGTREKTELPILILNNGVLLAVTAKPPLASAVSPGTVHFYVLGYPVGRNHEPVEK